MYFYNLHTHSLAKSHNEIALVNQYPQDFDANIATYSIGIHPWYIVEERIASDLAIIESKLKDSNCLAVGECGLDKRTETPFDLQKQVFEKQLLLAEKYGKPVIIHCVAAFQEIIETKERLNSTMPFVFHGFSKSNQLAKQLIDKGAYLSFGKYLLKNPDLESVLQSVPNDRFFLETDTMDESIAAVYKLAAKYKGITIIQLKTIIRDNCQSVFKIDIDNK